MKYIYSFEEGNKELRKTLGGKGANLAEMTSLGIPVPPGFTITTDACEFYNINKKHPDNLSNDIDQNITLLESKMNNGFGNPKNPLLVSVRSGAAVSMPGMMDTILNLGLNDHTLQGLITKTNNPRFAYDSYRRLLQMFGNVVLNIKHILFENELIKIKFENNIQLDTELSVDHLKSIVSSFKNIIQNETGNPFPTDVKIQLTLAINAVFDSWNNNRAISYRRINNIKGLNGTAVNIQSMVFGNTGGNSGTGVAFTRDPSTGERKFFGEFLLNAQGEDVVAGIRTPSPISELRKSMPEVYKSLINIYSKLETHYKDMQDLEFTIENGKLYILQTRSGKRTAKAAVRIAIEMVEEGLIDKKAAVLSVNPNQLDQLLHKCIDPIAKRTSKYLCKGLAASPGAAVGAIVFSAEDALKKGFNQKVILVRKETSPEDIEGMDISEGILTSCGGLTSHAAVVARGMGKCCVAGCEQINVDEKNKIMKIGNNIFKEGDIITLDGCTGEIFKGSLNVVDPILDENYNKLMEWADEYRKLKVRTNTDTPKDARLARNFGAEGIGLCRTEHMFFQPERIFAVRKMILSDNLQDRKAALDLLLPMQESDFVDIFNAMKDLPVTIRLLDPPLHEFLPKEEKDIELLANAMQLSTDKLKQKISTLNEVNPMLGHRGVRLAITYREIAVMQIQAIIKAACTIRKQGHDIVPEIMVPLVGHADELRIMKELIDKTAIKVIEEEKVILHYKLGTMIEVPRAALIADKIAKYAQFFSFGTNDLTQLCLGYSRDDAGKFIPEYIKEGILEYDPFESVDELGVGELMKLAISKGKPARKTLHLGICGEHGGDPKTVEYCHNLGLDYVSCSPYRVPVARLAAAHAALKSFKLN